MAMGMTMMGPASALAAKNWRVLGRKGFGEYIPLYISQVDHGEVEALVVNCLCCMRVVNVAVCCSRCLVVEHVVFCFRCARVCVETTRSLWSCTRKLVLLSCLMFRGWAPDGWGGERITSTTICNYFFS